MSGPETQTPKTAPSAPGRARRGLRIALVASLMLNLLLVGMMAGGVMRYSRMVPPPEAEPDFRTLWRALPDPARRDLRTMAREHGFGGDHGPRLSRDERRARQAETNARIITLLRTDPFDAEAFAALLDGDRAAMARRLDAARSAFARRVADLSPAERQAMAAEVEARWARDARRDRD